jgi:hypothetical protein
MKLSSSALSKRFEIFILFLATEFFVSGNKKGLISFSNDERHIRRLNKIDN